MVITRVPGYPPGPELACTFLPYPQRFCHAQRDPILIRIIVFDGTRECPKMSTDQIETMCFQVVSKKDEIKHQMSSVLHLIEGTLS